MRLVYSANHGLRVVEGHEVIALDDFLNAHEAKRLLSLSHENLEAFFVAFDVLDPLKVAWNKFLRFFSLRGSLELMLLNTLICAPETFFCRLLVKKLANFFEYCREIVLDFIFPKLNLL